MVHLQKRQKTRTLGESPKAKNARGKTAHEGSGQKRPVAG